MPTKKGAGPRQGQSGKKAQIEKMIAATIKKTPPLKCKAPPASKKQVKANESKLKARDGNQEQPLKNAVTNVEQLPKNEPEKMARICLPFQDPSTVGDRKPVLHSVPSAITVQDPRPYNNPNKVVVRLPPVVSKPLLTTQKKIGFLDLPGEIRNKIYDYCFPQEKYQIRFIGGKDKGPTELTYTRPLTANNTGPKLTMAGAGRRRRLFDLPCRIHANLSMPRFELMPGPAAFLSTCKQVNEEATFWFYNKSTFVFKTMGPLQKWLDRLRDSTKAVVRSLELEHSTGGEPVFTEHTFVKDRYDYRWKSICWQIADECCGGLKELTLNLTINDSPVLFTPHEEWMQAVYAFYDLGLKKCTIRLHCRRKKDTVCEVEAYKLRKLLLGDNFYEPTEEESKEKLFPEAVSSPPRRAKILRITGPMQSPNRGNGYTISSSSRYAQGFQARPQPPELTDPRATIFVSGPTRQAVRSNPSRKNFGQHFKGKGKAL